MRRLRTAYLILANTLVMLSVVLVSAHAGVKLHHRAGHNSPHADLPEVVKANYSHMTAADVDDLLAATWSVPVQYSPWVGFREGARVSRFVNVDGFGIRSNGTRRDPSSIQDAIWFFGGSTTFGYGVADEETIPAQLERILGTTTVNFGAAYYYSTQENVLLMQYLKAGYRPKAVLFLDGINETCDHGEYRNEMAALFAKAQREYEWDVMEIAKPVLVGMKYIWSNVTEVQPPASREPGSDGLDCGHYGRRTLLRTLHAHNLAERESTCRRFNLACLTLVQPFAGVHGRHDDRTLSVEDRGKMRKKFAHLEGNWRAANSVSVTDAIDQLPGHAYIDEWHYSASSCQLIADAIAAKVPATFWSRPAGPTGRP